MLPHCAVRMLRTISLHFFRVPLNGCRFWDGPIVFQRLPRFTTSRPPTSILWYASFDIPTFWCDMRFEELWVTWPNISLSHKSDPRLWGTESHARRVFLGKVLGVREQLAAPHVNSQSLLNERRGLPEKTPGKWTQRFLRGAFSSGKDKECGRDRPHHI